MLFTHKDVWFCSLQMTKDCLILLRQPLISWYIHITTRFFYADILCIIHIPHQDTYMSCTINGYRSKGICEAHHTHTTNRRSTDKFTTNIIQHILNSEINTQAPQIVVQMIPCTTVNECKCINLSIIYT